jgi:hypothetical protein
MTANCLNVRDFGAFGDGVTDDTKAIQDAINFLLNHPNTNRQLYFPGGTYKITDSLFIFKIVNTPPNPPYYDFVGLEICGQKPSYNIPGQDTILAPTFNDKPAIVLQAVKGVTIKDIAIRGKNDYSALLQTSKGLEALLDDSTFVVNGCRDNRYSPYAGICIDPYSDLVPDTERYPAQSSYYISGAASSSIKIEGCAINGFVTGIVIAPNGVTHHAANVLIKDCIFEFNKVSVAISLGSSGHIILQNITSFGNQFFVSTLDYGAQVGAAPFINGANVGGTKYLFNMGTTWGLTTIVSLHAQSTLGMGYISPGYSSANLPATFVGCHFEFMDTHPAIDTHLWSFAPINFIGCTFGTDLRKSPIRFFNNNVLKFSSCFFLNDTVGGLDENNDKTKTHYGEELPLGFSFPINVKMEDTTVRDLTFGSIIRQLDSCYNSPKIAILNGYSMPNGSQIMADDLNATLLVTSSQIKEIHIGNVNLTADGLGNATFTVSNPGVLKRGDLVSFHQGGFVGEHYPYPGDYPYQNPGVIGQIAKIEGSTVTLASVAKSINSGTADISVKYIPRFHEETKGDVTDGNVTLKNVSNANAWRKGDRLFGDGIPEGAYITGIDFSRLSFEISVPATKTTTQVRLYDADVYKFSGIPM